MMTSTFCTGSSTSSTLPLMMVICRSTSQHKLRGELVGSATLLVMVVCSRNYVGYLMWDTSSHPISSAAKLMKLSWLIVGRWAYIGSTMAGVCQMNSSCNSV